MGGGGSPRGARDKVEVVLLSREEAPVLRAVVPPENGVKTISCEEGIKLKPVSP